MLANCLWLQKIGGQASAEEISESCLRGSAWIVACSAVTTVQGGVRLEIQARLDRPVSAR
jgi:hypothetical protein